MTAEGGKPLIENARRGRLDGRSVRLLRRDRPRLGRAGDPLDRGQPAGPGRQGPCRPRGLHRALELPAPPARLEARAGAGRRQRNRLQAVRADPALHPRRSRACVDAPPGRAWSTSSPARARSAPRSSPTSGSPASPSPGRSRPASGSPPSAPSAWRASTSRWAARTPSSSAPTCAEQLDVAARGGVWAAFLNAGQVCTSAERFYVMDDVYDDYLAGVRRDRVRPAWSATHRAPTPTWDRWSRRRSARRSPTSSSRRSPPAPRWSVGGGDAGHERGHFFAPAVVTGRPGRDRPAARGDLRPGGADRPRRVARRGDRARELDPLRARREHLHAASSPT